MQDSESVVLSFASPSSSARDSWLTVEVVSAVILAIEVLVFAVAFLGAGSFDSFAGYAGVAIVFLAVWICLGLELIALGFAVSGAKYRNQVTFILSLHGLLCALLGIMCVPTLF